ncbi:cysteine desulfurase family protein [Thioflexithrix psekupsensis]|jgi:cysteine desulfurase|uniref:cysteine desulfurase n=1 Tax=Thioflexithrix psekupsensis TaxID=1570016 RepID=A0A251X6C7_9GAMM|nr:cysteine desulfurase family protein [Thioflexithrix psekupsensis]OUD13296.1 hypothetical protein TPSD3_11745 [Thioflexithrix psekupsensis]
MRRVYFDNNATTPLDERVLEAMLPFLKNGHGNASSVHQAGRRARQAIDLARQQVAALVNVQPSQVIFTSGGTEANNTILKGLATQFESATVAISPLEHPSILQPATALAARNWDVYRLPADSHGQTQVPEKWPDQTRLVSVMLANNETGVLQNVSEIALSARQQGILIHTDATQAAGKIVVDFSRLGVHFMTLSAHKFHGPQGVGALIINKSQELTPLLQGGGQEKGMRAGTENVAAIVGFGSACDYARQELSARQSHWHVLRQKLETALAQQDRVQTIGINSPRLLNTILITIKGLRGETSVMELDRRGVALSSGSACHSEYSEPSHVLLAMGIADEQADTAIRISFGQQNTVEEVQYFLAAFTELLDNLPPLLINN